MSSILLTATDSELLTSLEALLGNAGFQTSSFTDFDRTLLRLWRETPHCIIAQAKPSILETTKLVKTLKVNIPLAPIIVIATNRDLSHAMEALKAGAHDYIERPIIDRVLIESLQKAISSLHL
jgi:FixJ family two-component response regulator